MAIVDTFSVINPNAGVTSYFRATDCSLLTIADVIPLLSKQISYTDEYIKGQMKIWDSGSENPDPDNCSIVNVMVYADGWICAWFDKETTDQLTVSPCSFIGAQTLSISAGIEYQDQLNGCLLEITTSTDPECPTGAVFCVRESDYTNQHIIIHEDRSNNAYHFNTGYSYDIAIRQSNGNLVWWGHDCDSIGSPDNMTNRLYRAIYEMWEELKYSSNTTVITDTAITKTFQYANSIYTDYTTECNDATPNNFPLLSATEAIDDAVYFGSLNKFNGLNLNIGTAGVGGTIVWEYWNGSVWSSLSVTDLTVGYTIVGTNTVIFIPPDDWSKITINSSEQFWIRSRVTVTNFTTQPLLTQGWVRVPDALAYTDTNLGMYSFENTGAKYCLISGMSETDNLNSDNYNCTYFYNTPLIGKTIYSHSINYGCGAGGVSGYIRNRTKFYINGLLIDYLYQENSNGFIIRNIESIDTPVGSQNVFELELNGSTSYYYDVYGCFASVLITS